MARGKVATFGNGTPYVPADGWRLFFAWLIDFTVVVLGFIAGFVALAVIDMSRPLDGGVIALAAIALVFAVPLLYGLCYAGGRALGAVCTGTRLVRMRDGGRIGAKGPWAMLVRTVFMTVLVVGVVTGGGLADGNLVRTSIDVARTRRLHAEGYPQRTPMSRNASAPGR